MTPLQFHVLATWHRRRERVRQENERKVREWEDYRIGVLAAWFVNTQLAADAAPVQPWDVFPHLEAPERDAQTAEEQIAVWLAMGAKDLRGQEH